jgi:hypothetical protein
MIGRTPSYAAHVTCGKGFVQSIVYKALRFSKCGENIYFETFFKNNKPTLLMSPTVSVSSSTAISSKMNSTNGGSNPSEQVVSVDLVSKSHYHNEGKH